MYFKNLILHKCMILMAYYKAKEMIEFQITYTANLTARPQTVARNINKA